ncbi:MAG: delta-aminolevulinic acid dehydratase [Halioglobus sp.]
MLARWPVSFFLLLTTSGLAAQEAECECIWQGSFVDVFSASDLVISATVIAGKGNSLDLSVDRKLLGADEREGIRIWLKAANYCRPEAGTFPIGSQWVMALDHIDEVVEGGFNPSTPNISYGRVGDYSISSCGGYWLSQSENLVSGNLINAPRWVREPEMTPVLLDLIGEHIEGSVSHEALLEASREDPALRELMLDTRAFLRGDEE